MLLTRGGHRVLQHAAAAAGRQAALTTLQRCCAAACPVPVAAAAASSSLRWLSGQAAAAVQSSGAAEPSPSAPDAASATAAAADAVPAPLSRPRVPPTTQYRRKPRKPAVCWTIPPPARPTTEAEFEALKLKGYNGSEYDILTCYQLGQLFFDGVPAPKGATAAAAAPAAALAATSSSDEAPSFEAATAPWSLPKNYQQSLLWFTNAAFEGHVPSRTRLGVMYLAGYGIKRMVDVALKSVACARAGLFQEASVEGDRDAHAHLAAMHLQGMGTPKDLAKAVLFYTKAAERGHVRAQAALAKLLDSSTSGSLHNPSRARYWLREAARARHSESQFLLAQRLELEKQGVEALHWFTEAARSGHAQSQYLVGMAHLRGPASTNASSSAGTVASSASAAAAAADAESDLDARLRTAAHWFSQACEQGNVGAQARMGFLSYYGVGTPRNEATALMWLSNAAEANHVDAQLLLGSIAYDEHERQQATSPPAPGSREEGKKLATARAYFDKVLENANKQCTSLPSGALPLLVKWAQDAALPSKGIREYQQRTGRPWIGDVNVLLAELVRTPTDSSATGKQ